MKSIAATIALCALAAGCASQQECGLIGSLVETRAADDSGIRTCHGLLSGAAQGFAETPLAADTYRIEAYGNEYTSRKKTNAIVLVRAAELAAMHGYGRFVILDYNAWTKTSYYAAPARAYTTTDFSARAYSYGYGTNVYGAADSQTTIYPGGVNAVEAPRADIVVRFIPEGSPESASALTVDGILARYGKEAGYKPKRELQPASPTQALQAREPQPADSAAFDPSPAPAYEQTAPVTPASAQYGPDRNQPTLDVVYKSLSAGEKARVNRLPPAQRADYLEQIRERRF